MQDLRIFRGWDSSVETNKDLHQNFIQSSRAGAAPAQLKGPAPGAVAGADGGPTVAAKGKAKGAAKAKAKASGGPKQKTVDQLARADLWLQLVCRLCKIRATSANIFLEGSRMYFHHIVHLCILQAMLAANGNLIEISGFPHQLTLANVCLGQAVCVQY